MKIRQLLLNLPKQRKPQQMTFRFFRANDKPIDKPVVVFRHSGSPQPINNKGNKLDKFL